MTMTASRAPGHGRYVFFILFLELYSLRYNHLRHWQAMTRNKVFYNKMTTNDDSTPTKATTGALAQGVSGTNYHLQLDYIYRKQQHSGR